MPAKFPEIDYSTWRNRLEAELKNQTWEGIQWHIEDQVVLEPYYDAQNLPDLTYLKAFHEQWTSEKKPHKPGIWAFDPGLTNEEIRTAEQYGIQGWLTLSAPSGSQYSLPHFSRFQGSSPTESDSFFDVLHGLGKNGAEFFEGGPLHFHGADIHHAGGNAIEEMASVLVGLAYCVERGFLPSSPDPVTIHLATGVQFWLDLCKFRAMRLLWMNFNQIHGMAGSLKLRAETSLRYWSRTDSDINLLRNSVGVVSATLGGADELLIFPHCIEKGQALDACRLAADIGHLAIQESNLSQYLDPVAGSYHGDLLTHQLASKAWTQFQQWMDGGPENCLEKRLIQGQVQNSAAGLQQKFKEGKIPLVGVNIFQSDFAKKSDPFPAIWPEDQSLLKPLFLDA